MKSSDLPDNSIFPIVGAGRTVIKYNRAIRAAGIGEQRGCNHVLGGLHMNGRLKRITSLLLAIGLMLSVMPGVFAETQPEETQKVFT